MYIMNMVLVQQNVAQANFVKRTSNSCFFDLVYWVSSAICIGVRNLLELQTCNYLRRNARKVMPICEATACEYHQT